MEGEQPDLQLRRLSLIDFSSENDALVFSTSSPLRGQIAENGMQQGLFESLGEPLSCGDEMGLSLTPDGDQGNQFPDLMKSAEPDRSSWKTKCNLRKSLAWDNAFFTSAGVLDAEELSCMMEGSEKSEKKFLPGIEEDIRESSDSVSTLESDNLVLENLEAELFPDIRASIQRSSKSFAATSEQANLGESKAISSAKKKMILSSQNQKHTPDSKKPIGASKPPTRQTLRPPGIAKSVNEDARRPKVEQSIRPGNSNPTLKPPRVISTLKPTTTPTAKRASFAASDVKKMGLHSRTTGSAAGKVPPASKVPVESSARRVLPRPTLSSKTSSFGSSNSTKSAVSSLTDSSGSVSTEKMSKSNLVPTQRKVGSKTANPPAGSSSSLAGPSRGAKKSSTQNDSLSSPDSAKPSGLTLPSPKIGFFDGAKSARTPNGSRQSQLNPTMLPKTGAVC